MKRILINATQQEELRVAIVDGQKLYNLDIEVPSREQKKSSIFKGKITRIEPSLEAAFVEYGGNRHGFLPFKEVARSWWREEALEKEGRPSIKEALKEGQELIVQVEKEERGNKGAALTTKISLAGRYLVLMPTEPRAGGVSRRIEGEDRAQVREAARQLKTPEKMGTIVRTAGVGRSPEELQWDLDYLVTLWEAIEKAAGEHEAPCLLYHDSSVIIRALRDHYNSEIGEIIIDDPEVYKQAEEFMRQVMPHNLRKLKLYQEAIPLFSRFQIETQIESAFQREVRLPSGGAIVIDHTEALTSIDVNSARATKGGDIEETALQTNLEAAEEIARQLRLRDLGGLFVIDFIDMQPNRHQREVENRLKQMLKYDRARVQVGRISRFGLLELSRQRLRPSLGESHQEVCPNCQGHGTIRSVESMALSILRLIEEESIKEKTGYVVAHLPVDTATFLLNEKRAEIAAAEKRQGIRIVIVPDSNYTRPNYKLERLRTDEKEHVAVSQPSHQLPEQQDAEVPMPSPQAGSMAQRAVVQSVPVATPPPPAPKKAPAAPEKAEPQAPGLIVRLWKSLFALGSEETETTSTSGKTENRGGSTHSNGNDRQRQTTRGKTDSARNRGPGSRRRGGRNHNGNAQKRTEQTQKEASQKAVQQRKQESGAEPPRDKTGAASQPESQGGARASRGRRGGRRRMPPRTTAADVMPESGAAETAASTESNAPAEATAAAEKPASSRNRRRRRPRNTNNTAATTDATTAEPQKASRDEKAAEPAASQPSDEPKKEPSAKAAPSSEKTATAEEKSTRSTDKAKKASEKPAPATTKADEQSGNEPASETESAKLKSTSRGGRKRPTRGRRRMPPRNTADSGEKPTDKTPVEASASTDKTSATATDKTAGGTKEAATTEKAVTEPPKKADRTAKPEESKKGAEKAVEDTATKDDGD